MPTGDILGPEQEVDCRCPVRLERTILFDPSGWNHRVTACLRCGAVTLVESLVEEPRPHDVICVGHRVLDLSAPLRNWFDAWPRYAFGLHGRARDIFLHRELRVSDPAELRAAEEAALVQQVGLDLRARLELLGYPRSPPPEPLPSALTPYLQRAAGLALGPDTPAEELMTIGGGQSWAMELALPLLRTRPGYPACVEEWLASPDRERRHAALNFVEADRIATPAVIDALERMILEASRMENPLHGLANLARHLAPQSARLAPALREQARRIGDGDYYLTKALTAAAAALEASGHRVGM